MQFKRNVKTNVSQLLYVLVTFPTHKTIKSCWWVNRFHVILTNIICGIQHKQRTSHTTRIRGLISSLKMVDVPKTVNNENSSIRNFSEQLSKTRPSFSFMQSRL